MDLSHCRGSQLAARESGLKCELGSEYNLDQTMENEIKILQTHYLIHDITILDNGVIWKCKQNRTGS